MRAMITLAATYTHRPGLMLIKYSYTPGLSNVKFYKPGEATIYNDNNNQFTAVHLLVEADDDSWNSNSDKKLYLYIKPKKTGWFQIRVRGWICADGYTDCARDPSSGASRDQQNYPVNVHWVYVQ